MKYLITILFVMACGATKPWSMPIYCRDGQYICICDTDGNCDWQLICE